MKYQGDNGGGVGGGGIKGTFWTLQHRRKIIEHCIPAGKVNEAPSPQHVFLAPWFVFLNVIQFSCSCEETLQNWGS